MFMPNENSLTGREDFDLTYVELVDYEIEGEAERLPFFGVDIYSELRQSRVFAIWCSIHA